MANILNKKKLISLENYVFFFTKKPEKTYAYTWYVRPPVAPYRVDCESGRF